MRSSKVFRLAVPALVCVLFLGSVYLARFKIFEAAGAFLVIDDGRDRSDAIFLLNGGLSHRPKHAAELLAEGLAGKVIIARAESSMSVAMGLTTNTTDVSIGIMKKLGVSSDQIVELWFPGGVTSTFDEARALRGYLRSHPLRRVTVVTSEMHSRRSRWVMKRVLSDSPVEIKMSAVADPKYTARNWWKNEDGLINCQNEYLKLGYYFWRY
jgi:uncharacterized SAM-binding protein YcdF (DUF218 family)